MGYAPLLAGTWTRITSGEGEMIYQYAVLGNTDSTVISAGTLTFFKSREVYTDYSRGNFKDISGNENPNIMIVSVLNSFRSSQH